MSDLNQPRPDVLVVDDEDDIRGILRVVLELEGLTVADEGNPLAALARLPVLAPRVVLLDVMMPDLDGFSLLEAMRRDPVLASIPVVLLTCRTLERDFVHGLQLGAVDYVPKPFAPELLADLARAILAMSADERRQHRKAALQRALVLQQVEDAFS